MLMPREKPSQFPTLSELLNPYTQPEKKKTKKIDLLDV